MYTRVDFGKELKERVRKKNNISEIGDWAYSMSLQEIEDGDFWKILITLSTMELGPEFELTYERLNEIAG